MRKKLPSYYQHILGAYASYTFKLEKFSFRLGGRFEGTFQDVKFTNSKQKNFDVKFWDIIPSVSVSYNPSFVSNLLFGAIHTPKILIQLRLFMLEIKESLPYFRGAYNRGLD